MAISIEHFTAPGKYYIDLFFEEIEAKLKEPNNYQVYIGIKRGLKKAPKKECLFKYNPYHTSSNIIMHK